MDCNTVGTTYENDTESPWQVVLSNGTLLYCNGSYTMNWDCNATIKADADIAGPGVLTSFICVAWITIIVAIVPALCCTTHLQRLLDLDRTAWLKKMACALLRFLCDLQLVTGLAIVIAALAQIKTISFYHAQLAVDCWWLTLNSFLTARVKDIEEDAPQYVGYTTARRTGAFVSVVIGTVLQWVVFVREDRGWFFLNPRRCYLSHDRRPAQLAWPWALGASIYSISLFLTIVPVTRPWINRYLATMRGIQDTLGERWRQTSTTLQGDLSHHIYGGNQFSIRHNVDLIGHTLHLGGLSLCIVTYWIFDQILSFWSFGDGFYPLLVLAYIGFGAWTTYDIIDIKLSNRSLISGSETSWGFGQVLPMVLLLIIGYNALDASGGIPL